jgi:hypothetical protein
VWIDFTGEIELFVINLRIAFARQRSPSFTQLMNTQQLAIFDLQTALSRPYEINLLEVARRLTTQLLNQQPIHPHSLRTWLNQEFSGTDAEGKWNWKDAYEAQEIALISLLDLMGKRWTHSDPLDVLARLVRLEQLTIAHTRRADHSRTNANDLATRDRYRMATTVGRGSRRHTAICERSLFPDLWIAAANLEEDRLPFDAGVSPGNR